MRHENFHPGTTDSLHAKLIKTPKNVFQLCAEEPV